VARSKPRKAVRNAGAFSSPDGLGMIPVPMHTLSDEYRDEPVDAPDDREPEPEPPGLIERVLERLKRKSAPGH
jgi:hypothetical protein